MQMGVGDFVALATISVVLRRWAVGLADYVRVGDAVTQVKERPILFSGPMVRAILEGRKTQTRRIIKPQPPEWIDELHGWQLSKRAPYELENDDNQIIGWGFQDEYDTYWRVPFGKLGDRLWVRETCRAEELPCGLDGVRYAADNAFIEIENTQAASDRWADLFYYGKSKGKGVPSIHMPRWASRITLEIVSVRVERLQDISEADAIAEGVERIELGPSEINGLAVHQMTSTYVAAFERLWEAINGPGSWSANPWVWVVEFRRVEP